MSQSACHKLASIDILTFDTVAIIVMVGICTILLIVCMGRLRKQ